MTTEQATIDFLQNKFKEIINLIALHDIAENHWVFNGDRVAPIDRYTHLRDEIIQISKATVGEKTTNEYLYQSSKPQEINNECKI